MPQETAMQRHTDWEGAVISAVAARLEITYSDATGIVGAQPFCMAQAWSQGQDAETTAQNVIAESEK